MITLVMYDQGFGRESLLKPPFIRAYGPFLFDQEGQISSQPYLLTFSPYKISYPRLGY